MKTKAGKSLLGITLGVILGGFILTGSSSDAKVISGYIVISAGYLGFCIFAAVVELKSPQENRHE